MSDNKECLICEWLNTEDGAKLSKTVNECFDFLSNTATSQILSLLIGSDISRLDVLKHKKHSNSLNLYPIESKIDFSDLASLNRVFALDAVHSVRLNPGGTGSSVGIQALKNLEKIQANDKDRGKEAEEMWIEFVDWIESNKDIPEKARVEIADKIKELNDRQNSDS